MGHWTLSMGHWTIINSSSPPTPCSLASSPFPIPQSMQTQKPSVSLIRATSYEREALRESLVILLEPFGGIAAFVKKGESRFTQTQSTYRDASWERVYHPCRTSLRSCSDGN